MSSAGCTPRVGCAQLKNHVGKSVLFVGKIEAMENGIVHMLSPDGARVQIQAVNPAFDTAYAEIQGVVVDPNTIREESHVNFGDNFDLTLYNEFLKLANGPHMDLFQQRTFG